MRAGLNEMRSLAERIYPTVRDDTFFESCGVADLIATCYGGLRLCTAFTGSWLLSAVIALFLMRLQKRGVG